MDDEINELIALAERARAGANTTYSQACIYLIFLMQAAFSLYELAGTRHKNYVFLMIKNLIIMSVASLVWWLVGFGFYWGTSAGGGIGITFFAEDSFVNQAQYDKWSISFTYLLASLSVACTIIVERLDVIACIAFSFAYSLIIFPICTHWGMNIEGWLYKLGYVDLTGCGYVYVSGAASGLAILLVIGSRLNRDSQEKRSDFRISNIQFLCFSTLLFWYCRYGYNCGSLLNIVSNNEFDYSTMVGITFMNTTISPAMAGITSFFIMYLFKRKTDEEYSVITLNNGIISGLISIGGAPHLIPSWASVIIGVLSGCVYCFYAWLFKKLKLDDPLDSFATHISGGSWGIVAVGWFNKSTGVVFGFGGKQFGIQLLGLAVYAIFPFALTFGLFKLLKICHLHKMKETLETTGMDLGMCGGLAYYFDEESIKNFKSQINSNDTAALKYMKTDAQQTDRDDINNYRKNHISEKEIELEEKGDKMKNSKIKSEN